MTTDTTNSSKERMDCARVAREEVLEGYLLGRLSEEDRDAYEEHYFECERCFDELKTLRAARAELGTMRIEPESRPRPFLNWAAAASFATAAIITVALVFSLREPSAPDEITTTPTSSPPQRESTETRSTGTQGLSELTIEQLARVEPPRYEPTTLRAPLDEATQRFRGGMERYRHADYTNAVKDLRAALSLDPSAADVSFFLGVSELMLGHVDAAISPLVYTIMLGDSPYLEDAHFYLAKAFLRSDIGAADYELDQVIKLRGSRSEEASRLQRLLPRAAPETMGTISGTVLDSTGAALPGTKIYIRSNDTTSTRFAVTDAIGGFSARLPIGNYDVRFVTRYGETITVQGKSLHARENLVIHPRVSREEAGASKSAEAKNVLNAAQSAENRRNFDVALDLYRRAHQLDPNLVVDDAIRRITAAVKKRCAEALVELSFGSRNGGTISALEDAIKILPASDACAVHAKERLQQLKK